MNKENKMMDLILDNRKRYEVHVDVVQHVINRDHKIKELEEIIKKDKGMNQLYTKWMKSEDKLKIALPVIEYYASIGLRRAENALIKIKEIK